MTDNDLITTSKNLEIGDSASLIPSHRRSTLTTIRSRSCSSGACSKSGVGWFLVSLGVVLVLVTVVSLLLPKRYDASARILLDLEGTDDLGLEQVVMPIGLDLNTKLETQITDRAERHHRKQRDQASRTAP